MGHDIDEVFFLHLHTTALERGRSDIADQISVAMRRSRKIRKLAKFAKLPMVWRPAQALTKHMLRDSLK
jgi:ABC-type nitrate/sulfonate/bicarbonate transport system ATPase subunit